MSRAELERLRAKKAAKSTAEQPEQQGFSLGQMVSSIPSSAYNYGADMVNAITHPTETAAGAISLIPGADSLFNSGMEALYGGELETKADFSPQRKAFSDFVDNRYGSWDATKNTLMNDPVGMLADASAVITGGGSLIPKVGGKVAQLGAALEPVNAISNTARLASKAIPQAIPDQIYKSSVKFTTTDSRADRVNKIRTGLDEGIVPANSGADKLDDLIAQKNTRIGDLIDESSHAGDMISPSEVLIPLRDLKMDVKSSPSTSFKTDVNAVSGIEGDFLDSVLGKGYLSPREVQNFKIDTHKKINYDAKRAMGDPMTETSRKAMARGAKESLEARIPEIQGLNRELGSLYDIQPDITRAANRVENRNMWGLPQLGMSGTGLLFDQVTGLPGVGTAAGVTAGVLSDPRIASRIAIGLHHAKNGDMKWLENNLTAAEVRAVMAMAGREED